MKRITPCQTAATAYRNRIAFVLTRDRELSAGFRDTHDEVIEKCSLHEDGAHGPNILRVDLIPPIGGNWKDLSSWEYRTVQNPLPEWHDALVDERRSREALSRLFERKNAFREFEDFVRTK